jgi:preprotein translocase subunit SecD
VTKTRNLWLSIGFVAVLVLASVAGFATGYLKPVLGLDLEGGVSITLSAPEGTSQQVMNRTLESIRNRVDAFGVGEPDIFVTGTSIEVQIPGLANGTIQRRSVDSTCLIGRDDRNLGCFASEAEADDALKAIESRPEPTQYCLVDGDGAQLQCLDSQKEADAALKGVSVQEQTDQFCLIGQTGQSFGCFDAQDAADQARSTLRVETQRNFCLIGEGNTSFGCFGSKEAADDELAAVGTEPVAAKYCVISSAGQNLGCFLTRDKAETRLQETGQDRLIKLIGTTARLEERQVTGTIAPGDPQYEPTALTCATVAERSQPKCSFEALQDQPVTYLGEGNVKYQLGPVEITGDAIRKATPIFQSATQDNVNAQPGWQVQFELTGDGAQEFGEVTTRLVGQQLAIILDQRVISAPTIESAITNGSGVITGDFTEQEVKDLATTLNAGALPVALTQQQLVTVSPTLGEESLRQGLIAGVVGLVGLALYLLFYYRLLGIVAWVGMSIWAILAIGLIALAGRAFGYALTLAGIAGLVISLGVTADSYIVFYERLKDEVRSGKTPRSAVSPAFKRAYKTIVAADVVTGLAAAGLYLTAVSSVRGFALTLGVSTLLDLLVVYFFKRPTVFLIARNPKLVSLRGFGLRSGVAADDDGALPAPVAGGSE